MGLRVFADIRISRYIRFGNVSGLLKLGNKLRGDGFCVIWQDNVFDAPENSPVEYVIEDIKDDPNCFLDL